MSVSVADIRLNMHDVARYVGRAPQSVSGYVRNGLLKKVDFQHCTLEQFNRFLARKFSSLPRLDTVEAWDRWCSQGKPPAAKQTPTS